MMSDNWVVGNLQNALDNWNGKLSEIWTLITQTPETFKGGDIWNVIVNINGAVQAIGLALLVIFFTVGIIKTCGSFEEVKKPEQVFKLFIRFALAKTVITYGLELMLAIFKITQGVVTTIMQTAGLGGATQTVLPQEMITAIESCGFFESIPLWAVTLIRRTFSNSIIIYYDFICIWKIFQNISLCCNSTSSISNIGRRANKLYWKNIFEKFLCCVFRRSNYNFSLCNILIICKFATSSRYKCSSS